MIVHTDTPLSNVSNTLRSRVRARAGNYKVGDAKGRAELDLHVNDNGPTTAVIDAPTLDYK
jgi:hypothetical protein